MKITEVDKDNEEELSNERLTIYRILDLYNLINKKSNLIKQLLLKLIIQAKELLEEILVDSFTKGIFESFKTTGLCG